MSIFAFTANQNNGFLVYAVEGDIEEPVLDDEDFGSGPPPEDKEEIEQPDLEMVRSDVLVVVYRATTGGMGAVKDGTVDTYKLDSDGFITLVDSKLFGEFETKDAFSIVKVSDGIVAVVYNNKFDISMAKENAVVRTIGVDADGFITLLDDEVYIFGSTSPTTVKANEGARITLARSGIVAIAYQEELGMGMGIPKDGAIQTVGIDVDGLITLLDTEGFGEFEVKKKLDITTMSAGLVAVAYIEKFDVSMSPEDAVVRTFGIDAGGLITLLDDESVVF